MQETLIQLCTLLDDIEFVFDFRATQLRGSPSEFTALHHSYYRVSYRLGVRRPNKKASLAALNKFTSPRDVRSYDGESHCHCLHDGYRNPLGKTWKNEKIRH